MYELCILHYHKTTIQCATKQCSKKKNWSASEILDNFPTRFAPHLRCEIVFSFLGNSGRHVRVCVFTRENKPTLCKQQVRYNWIEKVSRLLSQRPIMELDGNLFEWQKRITLSHWFSRRNQRQINQTEQFTLSRAGKVLKWGAKHVRNYYLQSCSSY